MIQGTAARIGGGLRRFLFGEADQLQTVVSAISVSDAEIEAEIRMNFEQFGIATCPHTATATFSWRKMREAQQMPADWIIVATAHAAKFETIVEPLIGQEVPLPEEMARILSRQRRYIEIEPDLQSMAMAMDHSFSG